MIVTTENNRTTALQIAASVVTIKLCEPLQRVVRHNDTDGAVINPLESARKLPISKKDATSFALTRTCRPPSGVQRCDAN